MPDDDVIRDLTVGGVFHTIHNGEPRFVAHVSYTDDRGKRRFIRGIAATERDARRRLSANMAKRLANPIRVSPTVSQLFADWIDHFGPNDVTPSTLGEYRRNIERHVLPHLASVQLVNLDTTRLQRLFSHDLAALGSGARTNAYKTLSHMLVWAVNTNRLPMNPLRAVTKPDHTTAVAADDDKMIDKRTNVAIQMLEWLEQPDCPYHDDYNRVLFSFLGLRRAELLGMTWNNITNLNRKGHAMLRVEQQLHRSIERGWHIVPRTKNGKTRKIPLPEKWRRALLDERAKDRHTNEDWSANLVWITSNAKHFTYNDYNDRWHEILFAWWNRNRADAPRELTAAEYWRPHANRHLTASIMFRAGESLEYVQDILGHSDEIQTLWYTHFSDAAKRDVMNTYEQAIDRANWNELRRTRR